MALPPSQFGYSTSKPMHREARFMMQDRDKREKTRIEGRGPTSTNPLKEQPTSAGFANNAERFSKNVAEKLHASEEARKHKNEEHAKHKRAVQAERVQKNWDSLEAEDAKARSDAKAIAGTGLRNKGSVGYNLINGSWGSSQDAARAKYHDDCVEFAAKKRSSNLDTKGNSGDFNVITGEKRYTVVVPPVPVYHPPAA
jgi:hypothetical protein